MKRIAIIGMGLIGTSLGMALRAADDTVSPLGKLVINGYDNHRPHSTAARGRLGIDRPCTSIHEAVHDAHIVVVATPVLAIHTILAELAPMLAAGTLVTDVASTKTDVCTWAKTLLPAHVDFIGGHPMAGRETSGPNAADPELFKGAIYCLTPDTTARQDALDTADALVKTIGARPYYIDPEEHDAYVAGISHLPFLLSTALVETTSRSPAWKDMAMLAASGFRDMSRLAAGDVTMHRDICITNRTALIRWINDTIAFLLDIREHLEHNDAAHIEEMLRHAQQVRTEWMERT